MQVTQVADPQSVTDDSWTRERTTEELRSFINRRSLQLGDDLDEIDFELASI